MVFSSNRSRRQQRNLPTISLSQLLSAILAFFPWLLSLLILFSLYYLLNSQFLSLRQITCQVNQTSACEPVVIAEVSQYLNSNTLFLPYNQIRQTLTQALPQVSHVSIQLTEPGHLTILLTIPDAVVSVAPHLQANRLLLNHLGLILGPSELSSNIPLILYPDIALAREGDRLDAPEILMALKLVSMAARLKIMYQHIEILSDQLIILRLQDPFQAWFTTRADLTRQLTSLQLILSKATITPDTPIIDLRYQDPVLKPIEMVATSSALTEF